MRSSGEHNNNYGANFTNLYLENNFTPSPKKHALNKRGFHKKENHHEYFSNRCKW